MNSRVCHLRGLIKAGKQVDGMYFANGAHQGCFASMHWHQLVTALELNFGYFTEYWIENLLRYNAQHITSRIFKTLFNITNVLFWFASLHAVSCQLQLYSDELHTSHEMILHNFLIVMLSLLRLQIVINVWVHVKYGPINNPNHKGGVSTLNECNLISASCLHTNFEFNITSRD